MILRRDNFFRRRRGWTLVEAVISISVLSLMLGGITTVLHLAGKSNRYMLLRQRCIAAAQAQLDSVSATGAAVGDEDFRRLWPGLKSSVERRAGRGQWEGLQLVRVTVTGRAGDKTVSVKLARYIAEEARP